MASLGLTPDGRRLAAGSDDGHIFIFSFDSGRGKIDLERVLDGGRDSCAALAFLDADGRWLATGEGIANQQAEAAVVRVWDLTSPERAARELVLAADGVGEIAVDAARARVAVATGDGMIYRFYLNWHDNGAPVLRPADPPLRGHIGPVLSVGFQPDSSPPVFASAGEDSTVRLGDWDAAMEQITLRGPLGAMHDLAFDPHGRVLATPSGGGGGRDNVVWLWEESITPEMRTRRAQWLKYRPRLMTAIGECRGLLLSEFPQRLRAIATAEAWPAEILEKILARSSAHIEDPELLVAPAWAIACDPDADVDRYQAAADHAEFMVRTAPWSTSAHAVRGALAYRLGDLDRAGAELQRCRDLYAEGERIGRTGGWNAEWEPPLAFAAFEVLLYARLGDRARMNDAWASLNAWLDDPAEGRVITDDDRRLIEEARSAAAALRTD